MKLAGDHIRLTEPEVECNSGDMGFSNPVNKMDTYNKCQDQIAVIINRLNGETQEIFARNQF
jgi:hypothetical protein